MQQPTHKGAPRMFHWGQTEGPKIETKSESGGAVLGEGAASPLYSS